MSALERTTSGRLIGTLAGFGALAGLLIIVARNMSEARHFVRLARIAPGSDVMVMLSCFALTVAFDMVIAVTFGVLLAALMFMKRMAVLTRANLQTIDSTKADVPPGVRVYEIAGPVSLMELDRKELAELEHHLVEAPGRKGLRQLAELRVRTRASEQERVVTTARLLRAETDVLSHIFDVPFRYAVRGSKPVVSTTSVSPSNRPRASPMCETRPVRGLESSRMIRVSWIIS